MTEQPGRPAARDLRVFGLVFAGVLAAASVLAWRKASALLPAWAALAGLLASLALAAPRRLAALYSAWMRLARLLAAVNAFLVMGLLYFLVFTPLSLIFRIFGHDLLDLRLRTAESYWKPKEQPADPGGYERQF